jgi:hypothetical protein
MAQSGTACFKFGEGILLLQVKNAGFKIFSDAVKNRCDENSGASCCAAVLRICGRVVLVF